MHPTWKRLTCRLRLGAIAQARKITNRKTGTTMSNQNKTTDNQLANQYQFFVAMYRGTFESEAQAIIGAQLPPESSDQGELEAVDGSRILLFKRPTIIPDTAGLDILILEQNPSGAVNLWLSSTDLGRQSKEEADGDVETFEDIGGEFRVFQRK